MKKKPDGDNLVCSSPIITLLIVGLFGTESKDLALPSRLEEGGAGAGKIFVLRGVKKWREN